MIRSGLGFGVEPERRYVNLAIDAEAWRAQFLAIKAIEVWLQYKIDEKVSHVYEVDALREIEIDQP